MATMTVETLVGIIDKEIAPFSLAEQWDNCGLLVGDPHVKVTGVLVALDITGATILEARKKKANVIVSHHPIIFHPLKNVLAGSAAWLLIKNEINAICVHTCLDIAAGGVNDCLAHSLGLRDVTHFDVVREEPETLSLGRIGRLPSPMTAQKLAEKVKQALMPSGGVRFVDGGQLISCVAVCGGAGGSLAQKAKELGADALITSEIKHDVYIDSAAAGLSLLDAGHFDTEWVVLRPLVDHLEMLLSGVPVLLSQSKSPVKLA